MRQLHAVAFDIDGTLYPNYRMYMVSARIFMKNFKLLTTFGNVRRELRRIRPINDFYALQTSIMAEELGLGIEETERIITKEFYTRWENVFHHVSLYPTVIETLAYLKHQGLKLAVLSDFPVKSKLKILNIEKYFDVALCSELTGYLKPSPEPFQALLDDLGVEPEHLLYVGNSYEYDIRGADQLGIRTAHLSYYTPTGSPADLTFTSYATFLKWIKQQV